MDVSEVDNAADSTLVSEALNLIWGILDDLVRATPEADSSEYEESLERLKTLAHLIG